MCRAVKCKVKCKCKMHAEGSADHKIATMPPCVGSTKICKCLARQNKIHASKEKRRGMQWEAGTSAHQLMPFMARGSPLAPMNWPRVTETGCSLSSMRVPLGSTVGIGTFKFSPIRSWHGCPFSSTWRGKKSCRDRRQVSVLCGLKETVLLFGTSCCPLTQQMRCLTGVCLSAVRCACMQH